MARRIPMEESDRKILERSDQLMEKLGQHVGVKGAGEFRKRYDKAVPRLEKIVKGRMPTKKLAKTAIDRLRQVMLQASSLAALCDSATLADKEYVELARYSFKYLESYFGAVDSLFLFTDELQELKPFFADELKKPEYGGKSLDELYEEHSEGLTPGKEVATSLFETALENARILRQQSAGALVVSPPKSMEFALDKLDENIWAFSAPLPPGQIRFNMARAGSKEPIYAYYAINFAELPENVKITKQLTPFDKRVYYAINALYKAGNTTISLTQIHYAMGNITRPNARILNNINDAITKLSAAKIFIDNLPESSVYNYPHFIYDGYLLPMERMTGVANGKLSDAMIHLFRELPLFTFARGRKQITEVQLKLLQSPQSKTDLNIAIEDYLIERISHAKNKAKQHSLRILYDTLYEKVHITQKKQKQRAPEKITNLLDYHVECGFIKRYTKDEDGVTVFF